MDNPSKRKLNATPTPSTSTETTDKRRKVIGPSLPPAQPSPKEDKSDDSDSKSDSDDDFGPSLPPPAGSAPVPTQSAQYTPQALNTEKEENSAPKRDEWMLVPPSADSRSSRVDPTKLRSRKFQSGPRAGNTSAGAGIDSLWTETPEQKMRRLQDAAMGIVPSGGVGAAGGSGTAADDKAAQAMRDKVQKYNDRVRKDESMLEEKKRKDKGKGEEKEDDPSKRAFDREKDMALSSKLTHAQRREMVGKAADFGSRFSSGKFL
ncbi:hypothetical protein BJX99DRAFT_219175 [Aspergillus californicus]